MTLKGPGPVPFSCVISPVLMACNIPVRVLYMILYFLIHFNLQVGIWFLNFIGIHILKGKKNTFKIIIIIINL